MMVWGCLGGGGVTSKRWLSIFWKNVMHNKGITNEISFSIHKTSQSIRII